MAWRTREIPEPYGRPVCGGRGSQRAGHAPHFRHSPTGTTRMAEATPEAKILAAIRAIPRGQVAGYGEVARRAGLPGRARLVARILSNNDDARLPWHRVLRSDGRIAFPEGSKGYREQSQRLRAEGVRVEQGRVRGVKAARTLDEALWGPPGG
ncbi:MGMT family protein [Pseudomonas sp. R2.Fl]|nr:MGMT family protein [Pseudomonas sp. R2.Fl]